MGNTESAPSTHNEEYASINSAGRHDSTHADTKGYEEGATASPQPAGSAATAYDKNKKEEAGSSTGKRGRARLNYDKFSRVVSEMDLDVFFAQNPVPMPIHYPSVFDIQPEFIAMNDRLYRKAKEREDAGRQSPSRESASRIRKDYLDVFDDRKEISEKLQRKIQRSVRMYCHSRAVTNLFRGFFSLIDYHHGVCHNYPEIRNAYFRTIFTIFASMKKRCILEMLAEICTGSKMFSFYKDLYRIWEAEGDALEKSYIINSC